MKNDLIQGLRRWRDEQARIEGVEQYRVLNNATIEALVARMPTTLLELLEVKGIKAAKSRKYGKTLLNILGTHVTGAIDKTPETHGVSRKQEVLSKEEGIIESHEPLTVDQFLDSINVELSGLAARVKGEVTSVDIRERVVYFSLKDQTGEGLVNCVIFRYQYQVSGVELAIGDEVIVEGVPEIYKPSGRFSLKVGVIELAGEGALKKAYEALKQKLEAEGLFSLERKRMLPTLVERVALITSSDGAAIGDFTMNIGRNGMRIDFYPTAVEGKKAVFEIIAALRYFRTNKKRYDCLILIRGGGSLESLQAFNNEALVREVASSPVPVLCGVGHEKDITLASLVADVMVSTPTAAARVLAEPWEEARTLVSHHTLLLMERYGQALAGGERLLSRSTELLGQALLDILSSVRSLEQRFAEKIGVFPYWLSTFKAGLGEASKSMNRVFRENTQNFRERLVQIEQSLRQYDPERLLALGYSLVRSSGSIVRSAAILQVGDRLDIQFRDGTVESEIIQKL